MNITVDISPEVKAELARQAVAQGRALEAYAASLLEKAVHLPGTNGDNQRPELEKSLQEMFEAVRGLPEDLEFSRNPSIGRPVDLS
ncbi:MAG: hypothetical protein M3Y72_19545 [Acidobacteriota bacterium]|nr:hypothetical protein [Acidobacteriota bacterium]MDQ2843187.1 hypothetical protein [Acidobacteriota bacterium]